MASASVIKATSSPLVKMYADAKRTAHIEVDDSTEATIHTINFNGVLQQKIKPSGKTIDAGPDPRPRSSKGHLLTDKQIRARARRKYQRLARQQERIVESDEFEWMFKPVEEWSLKELSLGRPLPPDGSIPPGPKPKWVDMEVHEKSMELFVRAIKTSMNAHSIDALSALGNIINNNEVDHRGRPMVPYSTKLDATKFLLEHIVGKPTQHVTQDISVKLQGLLGAVMVNPNDALASGTQGGMGGPNELEAAYSPAHLPGVTFSMGNEDDTLQQEVADSLNDPDWLANIGIEDE